MSADMRHALRHVKCLANPSRLQAARWESADMRHALRHVKCLANPRAPRTAFALSVEWPGNIRAFWPLPKGVISRSKF